MAWQLYGKNEGVETKKYASVGIVWIVQLKKFGATL